MCNVTGERRTEDCNVKELAVNIIIIVQKQEGRI
jgi:hypothetical protein